MLDGYSNRGGNYKKVDVSKDELIAIHKRIVKVAKEEGIEFVSDIDYEKI